MATPAAPPVIASLWRRLAAMMYDSIVLIGIWIFTTFLVTAAFGIENAQVAQGTNLPYRLSVFTDMLGTTFLFFGWFWTRSGQTIGMLAWKIKIQNVDGSTISWRQVALRLVVAPFALLLAGIGYWWALFDGSQRSWTDIASNSMVARISNFPGKTN